MIWFFLLGFGFCFSGFFFLIDFIKNRKDIYNTYLDEESIPVTHPSSNFPLPSESDIQNKNNILKYNRGIKPIFNILYNGNYFSY